MYYTIFIDANPVQYQVHESDLQNAVWELLYWYYGKKISITWQQEK
jgi:hypothetical protein